MSEKIIVPLSMSSEMHSQLSQYAAEWNVPLESFLVMSAYEGGKIHEAIDRGYEINGRNQDGDEITLTEILYGSADQFDEPKDTESANEGVRGYENDDDDLYYVDNVRLFKQKSE